MKRAAWEVSGYLPSELRGALPQALFAPPRITAHTPPQPCRRQREDPRHDTPRTTAAGITRDMLTVAPPRDNRSHTASTFPSTTAKRPATTITGHVSVSMNVVFPRYQWPVGANCPD